MKLIANIIQNGNMIDAYFNKKNHSIELHQDGELLEEMDVIADTENDAIEVIELSFENYEFIEDYNELIETLLSSLSSKFESIDLETIKEYFDNELITLKELSLDNIDIAYNETINTLNDYLVEE
jgi:uncharacterized membrane protein YgaE (UPF0421/DUF939 family)